LNHRRHVNIIEHEMTHLPTAVILIHMSKRLQVILEDSEMREIRGIARRRRVTVAAWVRGALRAARAEEPAAAPERKLQALRHATSHSFPTADIGEMLEQTERGYADESE
jgi:hypothetical protein